jgi:FkbM family methyltransferase
MQKKLLKKFVRYKNIISRLNNWGYYIWKKATGFDHTFKFEINGFGEIVVPKNMMGPFRENFFDRVYFKGFPQEIQQGKPPEIVLDIGANIGFFSLSVFAEYPNSKIYAFEPHPYNFKLLKGRKEKFPQLDWEVVNKAMTGEDGYIKLNTSTLNGFATMASIHQKSSNTESVEVKAISLESFLQQQDIVNIDLIKLDCEGAEYPILYNIPDTLFKKIHALCIETHHGEAKNHNAVDLLQFLKSKGYQTNIERENAYTGYIWAWQ